MLLFLYILGTVDTEHEANNRNVELLNRMFVKLIVARFVIYLGITERNRTMHLINM